MPLLNEALEVHMNGWPIDAVYAGSTKVWPAPDPSEGFIPTTCTLVCDPMAVSEGGTVHLVATPSVTEGAVGFYVTDSTGVEKRISFWAQLNGATTMEWWHRTGSDPGPFTYRARYTGNSTYYWSDSNLVTVTRAPTPQRMDPPWSHAQFGAAATQNLPGHHPSGGTLWGTEWSGQSLMIRVPDGAYLMPNFPITGYVLNTVSWPVGGGALPWATYPACDGLTVTFNMSKTSGAAFGAVEVFFSATPDGYSPIPQMGYWGSVLPRIGDPWAATDIFRTWEQMGHAPPAAGGAVPAGYWCFEVFTMGLSENYNFTINPTNIGFANGTYSSADPPQLDIARQPDLSELRGKAKEMLEVIDSEYNNVDPETQLKMDTLMRKMQKFGLIPAE